MTVTLNLQTSSSYSVCFGLYAKSHSLKMPLKHSFHFSPLKIILNRSFGNGCWSQLTILQEVISIYLVYAHIVLNI